LKFLNWIRTFFKKVYERPGKKYWDRDFLKEGMDCKAAGSAGGFMFCSIFLPGEKKFF
jgi:hypothetical protein